MGGDRTSVMSTRLRFFPRLHILPRAPNSRAGNGLRRSCRRVDACRRQKSKTFSNACIRRVPGKRRLQPSTRLQNAERPRGREGRVCCGRPALRAPRRGGWRANCVATPPYSADPAPRRGGLAGCELTGSASLFSRGGIEEQPSSPKFWPRQQFQRTGRECDSRGLPHRTTNPWRAGTKRQAACADRARVLGRRWVGIVRQPSSHAPAWRAVGALMASWWPPPGLAGPVREGGLAGHRMPEFP
jgi:hypothetical protein